MAAISFHHHHGAQIAAVLDELAALRIAVFREWPYRYAGDAAYEARYLERYLACPRSLVVIARRAGRAVGATTAQPLADEDAAFRAPFERAGIAPATVCYFGESVVLAAERGQGIGGRFFDLREAHARAQPGVGLTAFCAVDRAEDDPRAPADYRSPEPLWRRRGYHRRDDLRCRYPWREPGEDLERDHRLTFWLRPLA